MTNAYTNKILFGHSNDKISPEYLEKMVPYMLTEKWMAHNVSVVHRPEPSPLETPKSNLSGESSKPKLDSSPPPPRDPVIARNSSSCGNTLFWSIHSFIHPKEAFLRPSAANVEIETRLQIVNSMRSAPKRLKDTNSKMTMEATQGLLGAMMTAREDRIDFCIAYSVYYGKHILIVYPKSYRVFSPSVETEIEDDDHVIILYASNAKKVVYSVEPNPTKQMADAIMQTKSTMLKAQSNYKTSELESIASKFDIPTKTPEGKRRKKEDLYNDVRLALHNDMNFVEWRNA